MTEKPKSPLEKQSDKANLELAQRIKAKRTEEALTGTYDLQSKSLSHTDFIKFYQAYFTTYTKKDNRVLTASFKRFKLYFLERHNIKN